MSVVMMLGKIVHRLILWCEEKDLSFANITLADIELYIKEKEEKIGKEAYGRYEPKAIPYRIGHEPDKSRTEHDRQPQTNKGEREARGDDDGAVS